MSWSTATERCSQNPQYPLGPALASRCQVRRPWDHLRGFSVLRCPCVEHPSLAPKRPGEGVEAKTGAAGFGCGEAHWEGQVRLPWGCFGGWGGLLLPGMGIGGCFQGGRGRPAKPQAEGTWLKMGFVWIGGRGASARSWNSCTVWASAGSTG